MFTSTTASPNSHTQDIYKNYNYKRVQLICTANILHTVWICSFKSVALNLQSNLWQYADCILLDAATSLEVFHVVLYVMAQ
jgi:hypothetical protein